MTADEQLDADMASARDQLENGLQAISTLSKYERSRIMHLAADFARSVLEAERQHVRGSLGEVGIL